MRAARLGLVQALMASLVSVPVSAFEAHPQRWLVEDVLQPAKRLDPVEGEEEEEGEEEQDSAFAPLDESLHPIFLVRVGRFRGSSDRTGVLHSLFVQPQSL